MMGTGTARPVVGGDTQDVLEIDKEAMTLLVGSGYTFAEFGVSVVSVEP